MKAPSRQTLWYRKKAAEKRAAGLLRPQGRPRWRCPKCGGSTPVIGSTGYRCPDCDGPLRARGRPRVEVISEKRTLPPKPPLPPEP